MGVAQKQGPALQRQQARKQQTASTLNILRNRAERQLRLRKLQLNSSVSQDRQRACLLRLLQVTGCFLCAKLLDLYSKGHGDIYYWQNSCFEHCLVVVQATETLRGLLDGLSLRVSHVNHVASDSGHIDIAWDFEV